MMKLHQGWSNYWFDQLNPVNNGSKLMGSFLVDWLNVIFESFLVGWCFLECCDGSNASRIFIFPQTLGDTHSYTHLWNAHSKIEACIEANTPFLYSALPDVYGQLHLISNTQNISLKSWWVGKIIEHGFKRIIITK
jgi:hypothetical protein